MSPLYQREKITSRGDGHVEGKTAHPFLVFDRLCSVDNLANLTREQFPPAECRIYLASHDERLTRQRSDIVQQQVAKNQCAREAQGRTADTRTVGRKTCSSARFTSRVVRRNGAARIAANTSKNTAAASSLRRRLFASLFITIPLSYGESNYASRAHHRCPSSVQTGDCEPARGRTGRLRVCAAPGDESAAPEVPIFNVGLTAAVKLP